MVYVFEEVVETERVVVTAEYEPSGFSFCCAHTVAVCDGIFLQ